MKNITVSVDDEIYEAAREEAARQRKSLSALVREFLARLRRNDQGTTGQTGIDPELAALFAMSDRKHAKRKKAAVAGDSAKAETLLKALSKSRNTAPVTRLNREELYDRPVLR